MAIATAESLAALFTEDETAWLEAMADLVRRRDLAALDLENLAEYLADMARRDRREVKSRLVILLSHLLKWDFQPEKRSRSRRTTILSQRQELADHATHGVPRSHAETVLSAAYKTPSSWLRQRPGCLKRHSPRTGHSQLSSC